MPRIPLVDPENLSPEQRKVYDEIVSGPRGRVQGPLLAALHRPELAEKWQQFGEILRYRTSLPPPVSEIAILTTAERWQCQLEWYLHAAFALKSGVAQTVIDDIYQCRRPKNATQDELAVYDFTTELHDFRRVLPETYQKVLDRWGVVGTVELTALIGYYTMVAMTLNAHEFPLPAGVTPLFAQQPVQA